MFDPVRPLYRWAIKTNVAYLAATVANLGVEYSFGDHYSIDLPIIYSPYTVARDYRLRFLAVQPEFRYWLKAPMKGHFFGVHLNIGAFNIAVDNKNRYQSPDGFYGVGVELRLRAALRPPLGSGVHRRRGIRPYEIRYLL